MNSFHLQISKLVLDEYFASSEFVSGVEAGAEFGLMHSSSTASVTTATTTSAIPLSHQLNSTVPFVDKGIDLNQYNKYNASIEDNEDEVFIVEKNGMYLMN